MCVCRHSWALVCSFEGCFPPNRNLIHNWLLRNSLLYTVHWSENSVPLEHLLVFCRNSFFVPLPLWSDSSNQRVRTVPNEQEHWVHAFNLQRTPVRLLLEMQVTLQRVGAIWGCVTAGMFVGSLGRAPLHKRASGLQKKQQNNNNTSEVLALGAHSALPVVSG